MKIKILIVTTDMKIDGANISLLNLIRTLDFEKYEVHLGLMLKEGELQSRIPKKVNVFQLDETLQIIKFPLFKSIRLLFKEKKFRFIINRILFTLNSKMKIRKGYHLLYWKKITGDVAKLNCEYDLAIAYQDNWPRYYIIDKVKANKKILWNHTTLQDINCKLETVYFNKSDLCVAVSESASENLKKLMPGLQTPCLVIENNVSKNEIIKKSEEEINMVFDKNVFYISTVARLSFVKGVDLIPKVAKILKEKNLKFKWIIIGEGPERNKINKQIKQHGVINEVKLLGEINNPFPYMKNSNLYIQPSRSEAKSMAVEEAKSLNKLVICTNYSTVRSQIIDGYNGYITDISEQALAEKIVGIYENEKEHDYIVNNLKKIELEESKKNEFNDVVKMLLD